MLLVTLALSLTVAAAQAADLAVVVTDTNGKPVEHAVVTWSPKTPAPIPQALKAASYTMAQSDMTFSPFVLVVPVGATVSFPNRDTVSHHVYSFSRVLPFQLPLYGRGQTRTVAFSKPGTVALGCNIHDSMSAYVRVVATPYFATTGRDGKIVLKGLSDGAGTLSVWHPLNEAAGNETTRVVSVSPAVEAQNFTVKLRKRLLQEGSY